MLLVSKHEPELLDIVHIDDIFHQSCQIQIFLACEHLKQVPFILATADPRFERNQHLQEKDNEHSLSVLVVNEELHRPQPIISIEVVNV